MDNIKLCEVYESNATCLCFQCNNYFCEICYKMIHDKNKSNHKKENIDPFIPIELKCPIHPQNPINLFCVNENGKYIIYINIFLLNYIEICCSLCYIKNLKNNPHKDYKLNLYHFIKFK